MKQEYLGMMDLMCWWYFLSPAKANTSASIGNPILYFFYDHVFIL